MKIDIVHPAHYRDDGSLVQAGNWLGRLDAYLPHLGPLLLAALTPDRHEVRVVEEYHRAFDPDGDADLVAISGQIMQIRRARDIARQCRERGKKVVLGGYLPTLMPQEVEADFDAIVIGEGDEVWPRILEDVEHGRLDKVYRSPDPVDLTRLPVPRYDLISKGRLVAYPVQATRGCPFTCKYCSIAAKFKGGYRKRPIEQVVRDVEATGSRNLNFCDDNLCEDIKYTERLFDALAGRRLVWGTQTTINVARHPRLLAKARRAGCHLMALGVESLSVRNMEEVRKTFHRVDQYAEGFERIMDAGISPSALMIFGLPADDRDTFRRTVDYLRELKVPIALFFLLQPYPGTETGDQMWREEKVIDPDLSHLREPYVVFRHDDLSAKEIHDGWWRALEDFYSLRSIAQRVLLGRRKNLAFDLATNLLYWFKVRRGVHPVYFGA